MAFFGLLFVLGIVGFVLRLLDVGGFDDLSPWAYLMVADDLSRYPNLPATPVYSIPLAVPRGVILLGFALMTLYSAMHIVRLFARPPRTVAERNEAQSDAP